MGLRHLRLRCNPSGHAGRLQPGHVQRRRQAQMEHQHVHKRQQDMFSDPDQQGQTGVAQRWQQDLELRPKQWKEMMNEICWNQIKEIENYVSKLPFCYCHY